MDQLRIAAPRFCTDELRMVFQARQLNCTRARSWMIQQVVIVSAISIESSSLHPEFNMLLFNNHYIYCLRTSPIQLTILSAAIKRMNWFLLPIETHLNRLLSIINLNVYESLSSRLILYSHIHDSTGWSCRVNERLIRPTCPITSIHHYYHHRHHPPNDQAQPSNLVMLA